jgi:hypothetical protein
MAAFRTPGEAEAIGVVREPIEAGVGDGRVVDHVCARISYLTLRHSAWNTLRLSSGGVAALCKCRLLAVIWHHEPFVSDAYQPCPQAMNISADRMRRHLARS